MSIASKACVYCPSSLEKEGLSCLTAGTVVSTAASQRQGPGFDSRLGSLSVWSLHVLPVSVWVSSGCSGFLPQSRYVQVRCIGYAKLTLNGRGISRVNT